MLLVIYGNLGISDIAGCPLTNTSVEGFHRFKPTTTTSLEGPLTAHSYTSPTRRDICCLPVSLMH
jgi:hypothetical protein